MSPKDEKNAKKKPDETPLDIIPEETLNARGISFLEKHAPLLLTRIAEIRRDYPVFNRSLDYKVPAGASALAILTLNFTDGRKKLVLLAGARELTLNNDEGFISATFRGVDAVHKAADAIREILATPVPPRTPLKVKKKEACNP